LKIKKKCAEKLTLVQLQTFPNASFSSEGQRSKFSLTESDCGIARFSCDC